MSYEILDSIRFQFLLSPISNSENFEKKFLEKKKKENDGQITRFKDNCGLWIRCGIRNGISITLVEGILKSLCFL